MCAQFQFAVEVEEVKTENVPLAHSLFYDYKTQCILFCNFVTSGNQPSIFRYCFSDKILRSAYIEGITSPSFIVPVSEKCEKCNHMNDGSEDQYYAVGAQDIEIIKWDGMSTKADWVKTGVAVERDRANNRFDSGVPDKKGRFFGGTLGRTFCNSTDIHSLYRYSIKTGLTRLLDGIQSSTGIAFDECSMYHMDSCLFLITKYNYDPHTGDIC